MSETKRGGKMQPKPHRGANRSIAAVQKAGEKWRNTGLNRAQRKAAKRKGQS